MKFRQYISAACGLVWIAVGAPVLAVDVESGLGWLEARQDAEGVHRAADIATAERTNLEAWRTVGLAGRDDGFGLLRARALDDAVQLLASEALRAELRIDAGVPASMLLDTLLGQQLGDGGFPSHPGFESDPETTARVLAALDRAGRGGDQRPRPCGRAVFQSRHSAGVRAGAGDQFVVEGDAQEDRRHRNRRAVRRREGRRDRPAHQRGSPAGHRVEEAVRGGGGRPVGADRR